MSTENPTTKTRSKLLPKVTFVGFAAPKEFAEAFDEMAARKLLEARDS
jgi:hypothetical protein